MLKNAKNAKFSRWFMHYQDSNGRNEIKFFNEGLISEKQNSVEPSGTNLRRWLWKIWFQKQELYLLKDYFVTFEWSGVERNERSW